MDDNTLREDYQRKGYAVFPSVFEADMIDAAREETRRMVDEATPDDNTEERIFFGVHSLRPKERYDLNRPALAAIKGDPRIHDLAKKLIGDNAVFTSMVFQAYMPHVGHKQSWHSDTDPADLPFCYHTLLVYLQDQTPELGQTRVVPQSQATPITKRFGDHADLPGQVTVEAPAGTVCAFQSSTWHSGSEGTSDEPRLIVGIRYCLPEFLRDKIGRACYSRARHARGYRRFGTPIRDEPNDETSYPWPEAYESLDALPYPR